MRIPQIPKPYNWMLLVLAVALIALIILYLNVGGTKTTISSLINRPGIKPSAEQQSPKQKRPLRPSASLRTTTEGSLSAYIDEIDRLKEEWKQKLDKLNAWETSLDARERKINQEKLKIEAQKEALDKRQEELNTLTAELNKKQQKLDDERKQFEQLKTEQPEQLKVAQSNNRTSNKDLKRFAKGLEGMKPKDAAKVLARMADDETEEKVISLLRLMDEEAMMEILSKFPDEAKATKLQRQILGVDN